MYFFARNKSDLSTELSGAAVSDVEVVRLGEDEVRKEVLAYYEKLAGKLGIDFRVVYDWDQEFVKEEDLGWERGC